jgi:hypothetical protein
MILAALFIVASGVLVEVVGLMACGVGVLPAEALVSFAWTHLMYQLYQHYLQRGGTAIALQVQSAAAPDSYEDE